MLQHVWKGAKALNRSKIPKYYGIRLLSARRRQRSDSDRIGPLDNFRDAYKREKFKNTQDDYMEELISRLEAPAPPTDNSDVVEKIIKKTKTVAKPLKTKKKIKGESKKSVKIISKKSQPSSSEETQPDRFPALTQEVSLNSMDNCVYSQCNYFTSYRNEMVVN